MKQAQVVQKIEVFYGVIVLFISLVITEGVMTLIKDWFGPSATELEPTLTGWAVFLLAFFGVLWIGYKLTIWRKSRSQLRDG